MRKIIIAALLATCAAGFSAAVHADFEDEIAEFPWAEDSVRYCYENGILSGDEYGGFNLGGSITRAQMARIFTDAFGLEEADSTAFYDSKETDWYYGYSLAIQDYMPIQPANFNGGEYVTREEFAATLVAASGGWKAESYQIIPYNFSDAYSVTNDYRLWLEIAVTDLYMLGDGRNLNPKALLTRAEACAFLYRAIDPSYCKTPIIGESEVTLDQALNWAYAKNAHQRFIDAAPIYWEYGELFGIRPDVMYAQAAKETGYGKYGGAVLPEMNNWAGIKVRKSNGDSTYDHESFATPEDGIRAHYNHMCAYTGITPIGEVHGRYYSVQSMSWAGTVEYVEQLGCRWCPQLDYGYSLAEMVDNMKSY